MIAETFTSRLGKLDSCAVSDALDRFHLNGVALGIKRLTTTQRIVGRVATLKLKAIEDSVSNFHLGASVIDQTTDDEIIVVDNAGRTNVAGWGGILSTAAKIKGISGVIIDGACRDLDEAEELNFPIFALTPVPVTARGRIVEESFNQPIKISGIDVRPGDFVIGDSSGVVFIPFANAEEVISFAEKIVLREAEMVKKIRLGRPATKVMTSSYESMLSKNKPHEHKS